MSLQQEDESVVAEIQKTADGKSVTEHVKFAYVIGADGGHSKSCRGHNLQSLLILT